MGRILGLPDVEAAISGGSVFAGGGGGWADHGRMLGTSAVTSASPNWWPSTRCPTMLASRRLPRSARRPRPPPWEMLGVDYVKAVEMLQEALGEKVSGLMIGQNGKSSTLNAWLPSAHPRHQGRGRGGRYPRASDRRHGLDRHGRIARIDDPDRGRRQPRQNRYIELVVSGATAKISPILRTAADMSGGFIACCRNPLRASYVQNARGARRHLAGACAWARHHRGGDEGRPRRDRRDLQDDFGQNNRRRQSHTKAVIYTKAPSTSAPSPSAPAGAISCST